MTKATSQKTLTPERLVLDVRSANGPAISPDGSTVLYSLAEVDAATKQGRSQLWLCDVDGSNARQITSSGITNSGQSWSPDGRQIAWIAKLDGEKPYAISVMAADGGEPTVVTRHAVAPLSVAWSPDGSKLAYTVPVDPDNPDEAPADPDAAPKVRAFRRLDYKQDNRGLLYDTRLQVKIADVASGEVRQLSTDLVDHTEPQWSPDGGTIAAKRLTGNGMHSRLALLNVATGEQVLVGTDEGQVGTWKWSLDGSFILFDGTEVHSPQTEYYRYDVASGERVQLTEDLLFSPETGYPTLGHPAQPVWLDESTALVHGIQKGESALWTIDAASGEQEFIAGFGAVLSGLSVNDARTMLVQTYATPQVTGEILTFDLTSQTARIITHLNDGLFAETPVGTTEKITVPRGGEEIDSWLTFPPGFDAAGSYPVVLDIHGGPHGNFGFGFDKIAAILANAGYIVVSPNPRGSGTYGRRFAELVRGDWGYGDWADLEGVLDAVLERPYADAERTAVMGYSYGGFMTSWAIGHTNRFKAAVCGAPVFDLESFYGTSDIGHVWTQYQWGGELPDHREWMFEHSPSSHIHNATTPTLVVHGEQDHRCPIGQGEQLFVSLSRLGVETEFVRYPGGSHLMFTSGPNEHKIDYYQRLVDWFGARV